MNTRKFLMLVLMAAAVCLMSIGIGGAATITVDDSGGADYTIIQAAVNAASPGDTINVGAGTYYENVLVNKSLKLLGENKDPTIINGSGGSSSIKLENVDDCIVSGFTLTSDFGIFLTSSNNNTVSNNNASNNNYGILLTSSNSNTISNNTANSNTYDGIHLYFSSSNKISNNNASNNPVGIFLSGGDLSSWKKNPENNHYYLLLPRMHWLQAEANAEEWGGYLVTVNDAEENLWLRNQFGTEEYFWIGFNDIKSEGNWEWVRGEPVTYTNWRTGEPNDKSGDGESEDAAIMNWGGGEQIDGEWFYYYGDSWNDVPINGYSRSIVEADSSEYMVTYLYSSSNNTLTNNIVNSNVLGIGMEFSSNNTLDNNTANSNSGRGIDLHNSSNNIFNNNTANGNNDRGIKLMYSKNNILTNNIANYNIDEGIYLDHFSNNNILANNTASWNFDRGIHLDKADNNVLTNNVVYWNNDRGIHLYNSSNNTLMDNLVNSNNNTGIHLSSSSTNNIIYHNNVINNSPNAIDYSLNNYWNISYPVGGNYWDDYAGVDQFSGPHQDQPGSDGIGDSHYDINNWEIQDMYPLIEPWYGVTDTIPPTVTIITPIDGSTVTASTITVTGTVSDDVGIVSVTVNGNQVTLTDGSFTITVSLISGVNTITIIATDAAGNSATETVTVTYSATSPSLVFAITPNSRIAQIGTPLTIFLSVINSGTGNATDISIAQASGLPATVSYQPWDGAALTGSPDTPVDIPGGEAAHFVLTINATAEFDSSPMTFNVSGTNAAAAPISSVNTLTMSASAVPYADIIMMSTSLDMGMTVDTPAAFALATSNVGSADATGVSLIVDVPSTITGLVCQVNETNPDGSIKGPATGLTIPIDGQPTFAVFLTATQAIDYDPANNRIVLKLVDGSGKVVGAQSVAVATT